MVTSINLADLNGTNGFTISGIDGLFRGFSTNTNGASGYSVSSGGDVNGDGIDDLIIGAPGAGSFFDGLARAGKSYVVFGSRDSFNSNLIVSELDGTNGFVINGIDGGV